MFYMKGRCGGGAGGAAARCVRPKLERALSTSVALHYRIVEPSTATIEAPPLVLLHGLFGSCSNFSTVARRCADATGRMVILPDLRNHGSSPWVSDCSFPAMAADLARLLDSAGCSQAVLCGHSLGGKAVMATSLLHADRVAGMVCVDIAPVEYSADEKDWRANQAIMAAMAALSPEALATRKAADAALTPVVAEVGVRQFLLQNLKPDEARWRLNLPALIEQRDVLRSFPSLPPASPSMPALFIAGSRSGYLSTAEHHAAARALFPSATFSTIASGHWVHAEAPGEFTEVVSDFCGVLAGP